MEPRVYPTGNFINPMALFTAVQQYSQLGSSNTAIKTANWKIVGPKDNIPDNWGGAGRINCIAFHPNDPDIMWVGAPAGGLWYSDDAGVTWATSTDDLPGIGVSDIAVVPTTPNVIYIASGDADGGDTYSLGVLKSIDNGQTWNTTGLNWNVTQTRRISRLIIHPDSVNILYAATSNGIYKTIDSAATWILMISGNFNDIEFCPGAPGILYASSDLLYRSDDFGKNWISATNGMPTTGIKRIAIGVTEADPNVVYALCAKSSNNGFYGMYKSNDRGVTFSEQATSPNLLGWSTNGTDAGGQGWYDLAIAVSPINADEVYVGGVNLWKSTDGGINWSLNGHWYGGGGVEYVHADQHALVYLPGTDFLFSGNDGGVFKTTNGGAYWQDLSDGLQIMQLYRIGTSATNDELLYCGAQDNGTNRHKAGVWSRVIGGDGMECLVDYTDEDIIYGSIYYGNIRRSLNGGSSWKSIGPASNGAWVTPYIIHPDTPQVLFAGYADVYKTTDRGDNWAKISSSLTGGNKLTSLAIAPSNPRYIYTATKAKLYMTNDNGQIWNDITSGLPVSSASITYITIHPSSPETLYVTFSGYVSGIKVYRSDDAGATWINVSGSLPNIPANCITIEDRFYHDIYIGTDVGVYYRNDTLGDWTPYNAGLPNVVVSELEIHYGSEKLRAATYGRGVWESDLISNNRPGNDAALLEIYDPVGTNCLDSIVPVIRLKNLASDTLYNLMIGYYVDSNSINNEIWSGNLGMDQSEYIILSGLNVDVGSHTFTAFVYKPNNQADEDLTTDTLVSTFRITIPIDSFPYFQD
ncbi:hypothetical protein JYU23_01935, partial [bacterium AH-315-C07]|nr:hypothetical protein [bacterium AH-315-C07]